MTEPSMARGLRQQNMCDAGAQGRALAQLVGDVAAEGHVSKNSGFHFGPKPIKFSGKCVSVERGSLFGRLPSRKTPCFGSNTTESTWPLPQPQQVESVTETMASCGNAERCTISSRTFMSAPSPCKPSRARSGG